MFLKTPILNKCMCSFTVLDLIMLPEMDLQPLSLEDSWRLRVASAQVYSIVKNRDVKNFERVMDLMENVYRLLPGLVPPIKHMKIVFGLKTLVRYFVNAALSGYSSEL